MFHAAPIELSPTLFFLRSEIKFQTYGRFVPVIIWFITTPWRCMRGWRRGSTVLDIGNRWTWVPQFHRNISYPSSISKHNPRKKRAWSRKQAMLIYRACRWRFHAHPKCVLISNDMWDIAFQEHTEQKLYHNFVYSKFYVLITKTFSEATSDFASCLTFSYGLFCLCEQMQLQHFHSHFLIKKCIRLFDHSAVCLWGPQNVECRKLTLI
jgi:hypothetical protein